MVSVTPVKENLTASEAARLDVNARFSLWGRGLSVSGEDTGGITTNTAK